MPLLLLLAVGAAALVVWKESGAPSAEGGTMNARKAFAQKMLAAMGRVDMRGIKKDLALALFSLETGDGQGDIFLHTNNPGSIKSTVGWTGKPSYKNTRAYATVEDGIRDWVRLISEGAGGAYKAAYAAAQAGNYRAFFDALNAVGYEKAINPPYNERLASRYTELKSEGLA